MKIEDIAKKAGVSKGTVSKVINGYPNISEKLKEKINNIIKENSYVPNNSARSLAGKKNKILGLFIYEHGSLHNSSYFASFVDFIIDEGEKRGYSILISMISSLEKRQKLREFYQSNMIDGAIFVGMKDTEEEIQDLAKQGYIMALVNYKSIVDNDNVVLVNSNNFTGARKATNYLIDSGCKSIVHLTGNLDTFPAKERLRGFEETIKDKDIKNYVIEGNYNGPSSLEEYVKFIDLNKIEPDGIFCANDEMAFSLIRYYRERGIDVGKAVKIIGFDNVKMAEMEEIALTTISVDLPKMAYNAVELLVKKLENKENNEVFHYESQIELIVRRT